MRENEESDMNQPAHDNACCSHDGQCFAPPHIIEAIKLRGSKSQQKMADALEKNGRKIRQVRSALAKPGAPKLQSAAAAAVPSKPDRIIYSGQKKAGLPGKQVRTESTNTAPSDQEVSDAFDGSGDVYELYSTVYGRDSLDNAGMTLKSTVHHRRKYNNAFWNGQQMAYGDGDGTIFVPLTGSLSVIGHELSHGVVQFSGGLVYRDQSGALNESYADVFGALTVQFKKRQEAHEADWLIGEGIFGPNIEGDALRSMKAPGLAYDDPVLGKDPQPYHMDLYVNTTSDNGGVHINSGIPNHAFYLFAQYLGGNAWERAGQVWYNALQNLNNPHTTFLDWAEQTVNEAFALYGQGSQEVAYLKRAWRLVGIAV